MRTTESTKIPKARFTYIEFSSLFPERNLERGQAARDASGPWWSRLFRAEESLQLLAWWSVELPVQSRRNSEGATRGL